MFDLISQGFQKASLKLKGQTRLSEENITEAFESIKKSLLDADVDLNVTKQFLANVKEKCLGEVVQLKAQSVQKTTAGNHFVKICHDEIQEFLGGEKQEIVQKRLENQLLLTIFNKNVKQLKNLKKFNMIIIVYT